MEKKTKVKRRSQFYTETPDLPGKGSDFETYIAPVPELPAIPPEAQHEQFFKEIPDRPIPDTLDLTQIPGHTYQDLSLVLKQRDELLKKEKGGAKQLDIIDDDLDKDITMDPLSMSGGEMRDIITKSGYQNFVPPEEVKVEQENKLTTQKSQKTNTKEEVKDITDGTLFERVEQSRSTVTARRQTMYYDPSTLTEEALNIRQRLKLGGVLPNMNILVIGLQEAGKSSLINSLQTAIDPTGYHEITWSSKSHSSCKYHPCDLYSHMQDMKDAEELGYTCNPRFYDCSGFLDEVTESREKVLELILEGAIPNYTNIKGLLDKSSWSLSVQYTLRRNKEKRRIHLIVYVQAADQPLPKNLVTMIRRVSCQEQQDFRAVAVMCVITKKDLMKSPQEQERLGKLRTELAAGFGISEVQRRTRVVSLYCDIVTPGFQRNPELDREMCALWSLLLDPAYTRPATSLRRK